MLYGVYGQCIKCWPICIDTWLRCSLFFVHFSSQLYTMCVWMCISAAHDLIKSERSNECVEFQFRMVMRSIRCERADFHLFGKSIYFTLLNIQHIRVCSIVHIHTHFNFQKLLCMFLSWLFRLLFSIGCGFSRINRFKSLSLCAVCVCVSGKTWRALLSV